MTLTLIRHGQSVWNRDNKFTGWVDVDLTEKGIAEAKQAGRLLLDENLLPDLVHTSLLKRAIHTSFLALQELDRNWIPTYRSWRLNERHYGGLAGLDKDETIEKYGATKVLEWRRSYVLRPPQAEDTNQLRGDPRYLSIPSNELPLGESLKDVEARLNPYWINEIAPQIKSGLNVLIVAHGNSLRALVKRLEELGDEEVASLEIPTGEPRVYEFDDNLNVTIKRILKVT